MESVIKLNLGGGNKKHPGWLNVDIDQSADVLCDVRNIPLPDNYADAAMAIHVIEHFFHFEVQDVLWEWFRILKPGAKLILECPDIYKAAKAMLKEIEAGTAPSGSMVMWPLYGDPRHINPYMCHKWGYIPETLMAEMVKAGFKDVQVGIPEFHKGEVRDLRVTGVKPC